MIGLVLVTHGRLAEELRAAMEHVVGAQRNVATVCIGPEDDMERRREEIQTRINQVIPRIEELELELRRKLEEKEGGQVRTGGVERVPQGYADAVAEYFRRLSKSK